MSDQTEREALLSRRLAAVWDRADTFEARALDAEERMRTVEALHHPVAPREYRGVVRDWCEADGRPWPCPTTAILHAAPCGAADAPAEFTPFERAAAARLAETDGVRFCNDAGIITHGPGADEGWTCTGSVHYGSTEVPCASPIHRADLASPVEPDAEDQP